MDVYFDFLLQTVLFEYLLVFLLHMLVKTAFRPVAFLTFRNWTLEISQYFVSLSSNSLSFVHILVG